jgi:hypothetical protein
MAGGLNTCSDNDDYSSDEHSYTTAYEELDAGCIPDPCRLTSEISCWTSGERSDNVANGVDGVDNTSSRGTCNGIKMEVVAVLGIAVDGTHEGSIVTIDTGIESCDE